MRLLIVEDEVRLAEALQRGLEAEGFEADLAFDGNTGLARSLEERYDAIVLDILLPGMNGYRVCAEIRAAGNWTPILMLTAKSGEFDEAEALDTGADGCGLWCAVGAGPGPPPARWATSGSTRPRAPATGAGCLST
jgi:two-component system OmpR family response regulator